MINRCFKPKAAETEEVDYISVLSKFQWTISAISFYVVNSIFFERNDLVYKMLPTTWTRIWLSTHNSPWGLLIKKMKENLCHGSSHDAEFVLVFPVFPVLPLCALPPLLACVWCVSSSWHLGNLLLAKFVPPATVVTTLWLLSITYLSFSSNVASNAYCISCA